MSETLTLSSGETFVVGMQFKVVYALDATLNPVFWGRIGSLSHLGFDEGLLGLVFEDGREDGFYLSELSIDLDTPVGDYPFPEAWQPGGEWYNT